VVTEVLSSAADEAVADVERPLTLGTLSSTNRRQLVSAFADEASGKDLDSVVAEALALGLHKVQMLAWRDFEDPEAGGSELYAHRVGGIWANAGLDVTLRSSTAEGLASLTSRDGYRVIRRSGRYMVFPRSALSGLVGRRGRPDGLVEVWNGMPFFSPIWAHCPRVVLVHHVHAEMWRMVLTPKLARLGETIELKVAPRFYRRSRVVTVSDSSREELVSRMGFDPDRITLATGGIDERFTPGGRKSRTPLVLAVGRLVPVKRLDLLIDALVDARRFVPNLEAIIVGEGYERPKIEAQLARMGAQSWVHVAGHVPDDDLVDLYRRAWVVTSTSAREGWNLTITEAGACGTPAVVSAVVGHQDNIRQEVSGLLATPGRDFTAALVRVLTDEVLRERLSHGALARAREFTWEATATSLLSALVEEKRNRS
jgi:glycosyltransferase involved in cell wall biosynthesis